MENILSNNKMLVCKHNRLINASYKLNLGEQKLVLAISAMINPKDEDFKEYKLSVNEFAKLMNVDLEKNTALYSRLKRKSSNLLNRRITIHESDGDLQSTWFASIKYFDKEGKMGFCFAPRLKKYYLQLQAYTKYSLTNIADLNSHHSIRIYELLKQYEKIGQRTFNLTELKKAIGLDVEHYTRFYDFKNRVIFVSQKELKEKTDIYFDYEEIKTGRKITAIKFYIFSKKNHVSKEIATTKEDLLLCDNTTLEKEVKALIEYKIHSKDIKKIIEVSNYDISKIQKAYEQSKKYKDNISNITGFLITAIKNEWDSLDVKKNTRQAQVNPKGFINFKQRTDWDFEELERLEMEYQEKKLLEDK